MRLIYITVLLTIVQITFANRPQAQDTTKQTVVLGTHQSVTKNNPTAAPVTKQSVTKNNPTAAPISKTTYVFKPHTKSPHAATKCAPIIDKFNNLFNDLVLDANDTFEVLNKINTTFDEIYSSIPNLFTLIQPYFKDQKSDEEKNCLADIGDDIYSKARIGYEKVGKSITHVAMVAKWYPYANSVILSNHAIHDLVYNSFDPDNNDTFTAKDITDACVDKDRGLTAIFDNLSTFVECAKVPNDNVKLALLVDRLIIAFNETPVDKESPDDDLFNFFVDAVDATDMLMSLGNEKAKKFDAEIRAEIKENSKKFSNQTEAGKYLIEKLSKTDAKNGSTCVIELGLIISNFTRPAINEMTRILYLDAVNYLRAVWICLSAEKEMTAETIQADIKDKGAKVIDLVIRFAELISNSMKTHQDFSMVDRRRPWVPL